MRISAIAAPIAAFLTIVLAAPANLTLPDDTNILDLEIMERCKHKHVPVVAKVQLWELDYNGDCVQEKEFKRGKALKAYSGECLKFKAASDPLVREFTYIPSDKLKRVRKGAESEDGWVHDEQTCAVKAFESEDCSSGEVEGSHVLGDQFWELATTKPPTKNKWKPGPEGWHFRCIHGRNVRSVRFDCPGVNWAYEKKGRDSNDDDKGGYRGWYGAGH